MANDVLILGGYAFEDFSTPDEMMGGGAQAMVVHKLPGGSRVIDTLGPDEAPITWRGTFFSASAYSDALLVDGMRVAGDLVPLIWGGQTRQVIIDNFIYKVHRFPNWVTYHISCTVYQNPGLGDLSSSTSSVDTAVANDLSTASSAASDQGTAIGGVGGSGL